MKRISTFLAAVAMLAATSVASAADKAWFNLVSSNGVLDAPVAENQDGPLIININPATVGSATSLRIGYNFTSSTPMSGWAISLAALGTPGNVGVFASGPVGAGNGYDSGVGGTNGSSAFSAGQGSLAGSGASGHVYEFNLNLTSLLATGSIAVTGDFGPTEQFYNTGYAWYGSVAGGPISYGKTAYSGAGFGPDDTVGWGSHPVILINVVPEPATLCLLGLGAVALLRRRK